MLILWDSAKFLGYVISAEGVSVDPTKIETILNWPEPKDSSDVRSFLGLGNHFKRFIQGYSKLTSALVELTKPSVKFNFNENEAAQNAFKQLKTCLTEAPVLALPAVNEPFEMVCDASGFGCGAVLKQNDEAIAYYSYRMNERERNYSVGEQELLAVVKAFQYWRCYLEGATKVTVITDHMPNTFLTSKPAVQLTRRQVHWQEILSQFDLERQYTKGKANVADPLSRNAAFLNVLSANEMKYAPDLSKTANHLLNEVKSGYEKDPWFQIQRNSASLTFEDGFFMKGKLIVVPNVGNLKIFIISQHHDLPFAGHFAIEKTLRLVRQGYWWPLMKKDVDTFVRSCPSCQQNKVSSLKPAGLLQPLPVPEFRWERISVDLITHLPMTKQGHTAIVVFVDAFSKMVHFAPVWDDMGSEEFANVFMRGL